MRPHHYILLFSALTLAGCSRPAEKKIQGYAEGEYVYVSSPLSGTLQELSVQRGAQVKSGEYLFGLEYSREKAAFEEALRRLNEAKAKLEDARKGQRETEVQSMEEQLKQARAALALSEKSLTRQEELSNAGAGTTNDLDTARSTRDRDQHRVSQLEADLKTVRLGSREDLISAAQANVDAVQFALEKARWDVDQKKQNAPVSGLVFDTLYRVGEWVPAGHPVVTLLPPEYIKVRAFVPEQAIGTIKVGQKSAVHVDGISEALPGTVTYISPEAEYTPPVIYSQQSRGKLVFMVELHFDPQTAVKLHPGQPVDVEFQ